MFSKRVTESAGCPFSGIEQIKKKKNKSEKYSQRLAGARWPHSEGTLGSFL